MWKVVLATTTAVSGLLIPEISSGQAGELAIGLPVPLESTVPQTTEMGVPARRPKSYYVATRSSGTSHEGEPPRYVRNLGEWDLWEACGPPWLDLGLDYRMRYEYRDDDLRRPVQVLDEPFLQRTRVYLGIREIFDPLRGAVEFGDSRIFDSRFPDSTRDVNESDIIQMFGELYFADALGENRPLRFQYGRLAFDYLDRRLIARNRWRNTTNTFQGFRAIFGQRDNEWQFDLLAVQPVERFLTAADRADDGQWFYAAIGDWRRWSEIVTIQPYYLLLDQSAQGEGAAREIHTLGVRGYGVAGETGWDYDVQGIFQFGSDGPDAHQAYAFTSELGHTFVGRIKPRLSGFLGYASGDRDPNDAKVQHFDRLFGFARPWSPNDYVSFENVVAPKVRLQLYPLDQVLVEMGYGVFWLASATDGWRNVKLRDPLGQSGTFLGHELDVRLRFNLREHAEVTLGYAHFIPGEFPRNTGKPDASDFFYVEVAPRLFK